jgi:hypothetical protein
VAVYLLRKPPFAENRATAVADCMWAAGEAFVGAAWRADRCWRESVLAWD